MMLRAILNLFAVAPAKTLSAAAIAAELDISPALLDHMLRTLVRSGRLVEVELCSDCSACALRRICVGGLDIARRGYRLTAERSASAAAAYTQ